GRLVIQEWGPEDSISLGLSDLLADHAVDAPDERLAALRARLDTFAPLWTDHLQDVDDYRERLAEARLIVDDAVEVAPLKIPLHPDQYLAFWRARTDRFEEIQAMNKDRRAAFEAAARASLRPFTTPDGWLIWQPVVFRVSTRR
ncbi:MAG: hypothetical protein HY866_09960, partial [Chloroflexi bacterium]|nr:hypothetical protein [Chloroflexota bacterium]